MRGIPGGRLREGREAAVPGRMERRARRKWSSLALGACGALLVLGALVAAVPLKGPRSLEQISRLMAGGPHPEDCAGCHVQHGEGAAAAYDNLLTGPNDNSFCYNCHTQAWKGGSFAGSTLYEGSDHGSSVGMAWPGPDPMARTDPGAAGKCVNCHDPHGWSDPAGTIPFLAVQREERLCLACHDGSPALGNVRDDLLKAYRHPITDYSGRHTGPTESLPSDFAVSPVNRRHAECQDCHNPHVARADRVAPLYPNASKTLLGVSRVRVSNGIAGTAPSYLFTAASDTLSGPPTEYQLCFKCHSSWTIQPSGQSDLAKLLNPSNPSIHPVEARGRNTNIRAAAFVAPWSALSLTGCGDCHGSDTGAPGPHGSSYRYILKRPATASSAFRPMGPDELCFQCHNWDVYASTSSSDITLSASRFNRPAFDAGHSFHVGQKQVPCYACHTTHGSTTLQHLMATGRSPGIIRYNETPVGGTCSPTCHSTKPYTLNYAR